MDRGDIYGRNSPDFWQGGQGAAPWRHNPKGPRGSDVTAVTRRSPTPRIYDGWEVYQEDDNTLMKKKKSPGYLCFQRDTAPFDRDVISYGFLHAYLFFVFCRSKFAYLYLNVII